MTLTLKNYLFKICPACDATYDIYETVCEDCDETLLVAIETEKFTTAFNIHLDRKISSQLQLNRSDFLKTVFKDSAILADYLEQATLHQLRKKFVDQDLVKLQNEVLEAQQLYSAAQDGLYKIQQLLAQSQKKLETLIDQTAASPPVSPELRMFQEYTRLYTDYQIKVKTNATDISTTEIGLKTIKEQIEKTAKCLENQKEIKIKARELQESLGILTQIPANFDALAEEYRILLQIASTVLNLRFENGVPIPIE